MARRGGRGGLGMGPMAGIVAIVLGLVVVIALYTFVPGIGAQIEAATPAPSPTSQFNASCRSALGLVALPTGAGFWASTSGLITMVVTVILIGIAIAALISMVGRR